MFLRPAAGKKVLLGFNVGILRLDLALEQGASMGKRKNKGRSARDNGELIIRIAGILACFVLSILILLWSAHVNRTSPADTIRRNIRTGETSRQNSWGTTLGLIGGFGILLGVGLVIVTIAKAREE